MPDLALIPTGPLRELADRLDAVADTAGPDGMSVEALMARSGSYRRAASAVRHAVDTATGPVGFVVARAEARRLVDDWDGEIHPDLVTGQASLKECRAGGHLGYGLYALTEVPYV